MRVCGWCVRRMRKKELLVLTCNVYIYILFMHGMGFVVVCVRCLHKIHPLTNGNILMFRPRILIFPDMFSVRYLYE